MGCWGLLGVAGGCWDDYETSDEMDHSRKFPTFSTSKDVLKILEAAPVQTTAIVFS